MKKKLIADIMVIISVVILFWLGVSFIDIVLNNTDINNEPIYSKMNLIVNLFNLLK